MYSSPALLFMLVLGLCSLSFASRSTDLCETYQNNENINVIHELVQTYANISLILTNMVIIHCLIHTIMYFTKT